MSITTDPLDVSNNIPLNVFPGLAHPPLQGYDGLLSITTQLQLRYSSTYNLKGTAAKMRAYPEL